MDGIPVNLDDIDALAQTLDAGSAKDFLSSLVTALRAVSGGEESLTVSVQVGESLQDTFDAAFESEPEPAPKELAAGYQIHLSVMKIGRSNHT
jgi:hypothetical protein